MARFAWRCLAVFLFFSSCMYAQIKAPVFQPNSKITLIVKFQKKLIPGSTVDVQFQRKSKPSEVCHNESYMNWSGNSQDNQTFEMTLTLSEDIAPGTYIFSHLTVSSPGFAPGNSDQPVALTLEVENHIPCPKPVEVPQFDISVKP
jgi:hypothetical protein